MDLVIMTLPKTIFNFPGPLITVSVARYWSPKACLPMHIGFLQPVKTKHLSPHVVSQIHILTQIHSNAK